MTYQFVVVCVTKQLGKVTCFKGAETLELAKEYLANAVVGVCQVNPPEGATTFDGKDEFGDDVTFQVLDFNEEVQYPE